MMQAASWGIQSCTADRGDCSSGVVAEYDIRQGPAAPASSGVVAA